MKKQKLWIFAGSLVMVVLGMFFVFGKALAHNSLEDILRNNEAEITEQITMIIQDAEKVRYELDSCKLEIIHVEGDRADCILGANWKSIRTPQEDPFIQGMRQAAAALTDQQEKGYAQEIIDGWIVEMESWPEVDWIDTQIVILSEGGGTWELYYPYRMDGVETLIPLKQYAEDNWTEDADARRQWGIDTINEAIGLFRNPQE